MAADSDQSIFAASDQQSLAVPISTGNLFGMFSHGRHLPFVLFVVKIQIAFLVSTCQDWMSQGPLHPSDRLFLILEGELINHAGCEGSPQ